MGDSGSLRTEARGLRGVQEGTHGTGTDIALRGPHQMPLFLQLTTQNIRGKQTSYSLWEKSPSRNFQQVPEVPAKLEVLVRAQKQGSQLGVLTHIHLCRGEVDADPLWGLWM